MPRPTPRLPVTLCAFALLAVSCGAGQSPALSPTSPGPDHQAVTVATDPMASGPVVVAGASRGGTVTVLTHTGLTTSLDPADAAYVDTVSIDSSLITRTLTQYRYDPTTGQNTLVPDLATDLGRHNRDYTRWTFTIRDGVRFEDGAPVRAANVAWGIQRCMDGGTFPNGPCSYYARSRFRDGSTYGGPYTSPHQEFDAVTVRGKRLILHMDRPFPDLPFFATFPAMGPAPLGSAADPPAYANHPLATGPYRIATYSRAKELVLERNPFWDPATDPARTQYPDRYVFEAQQDQDRIDQILLTDSGPGRRTLTYDNLQASDYAMLRRRDGSRVVEGTAPCTAYWAPDNRKVTDKHVREALSWAFPYRNVILAQGLVPGVTAFPATNLMPPGIPGRVAFADVTGRTAFASDPQRSRRMLERAGALGYDIRFLFRTDDAADVRVKDAIVKALTAGGFTATPVATTIGGYAADRANPDSNLNVRSGSWCSGWPSGSTWLPMVYADTHPSRTGSLGPDFAAFHAPWVTRRVAAIQLLPLDRQPAAWNALDREVMARRFPLFPTWYSGLAMAHGSEIRGMGIDSTGRMPSWKTLWVGR